MKATKVMNMLERLAREPLSKVTHIQGMIRPKGLYVAPKVLVGLGTPQAGMGGALGGFG